MSQYVTKDSGAREQFDSGMQRDTQAGKLRYELALDGPLAARLFRGDRGVLLLIEWLAGRSDGTELCEHVIEDEGGLDAMIERYAGLMTRGAEKYNSRNWMLAAGTAEYERFQSSAARHYFEWRAGKEDEDHAAAVLFNVNGAEYVLPTAEVREEAGE